MVTPTVPELCQTVAPKQLNGIDPFELPDPFDHPQNLSIEALDQQIVSLSARMAAEEYRMLSLIREFDERGGWLKWGSTSCADWLHWRCDLSLSASREKVRVHTR